MIHLVSGRCYLFHNTGHLCLHSHLCKALGISSSAYRDFVRLFVIGACDLCGFLSPVYRQQQSSYVGVCWCRGTALC